MEENKIIDPINEIEEIIDEEPIESKIAGHQALINQLYRMINVSNDDRMKQVFMQEIASQEREIEALKAGIAKEEEN